MASVARGNEGWPRSAAQWAHARRAQVPARSGRGGSAREREKGERKRSGERKENVNGLTQSKLKICN